MKCFWALICGAKYGEERGELFRSQGMSEQECALS